VRVGLKAPDESVAHTTGPSHRLYTPCSTLGTQTTSCVAMLHADLAPAQRLRHRGICCPMRTSAQHTLRQADLLRRAAAHALAHAAHTRTSMHSYSYTYVHCHVSQVGQKAKRVLSSKGKRREDKGVCISDRFQVLIAVRAHIRGASRAQRKAWQWYDGGHTGKWG